jgi:VanZ family protein
LFNFLERNKVLLVYLPLVFYWILLLTLTSLPVHSVPSVGVNDKLEHTLAYLGLSFLLCLTLLLQTRSLVLRKHAVFFTLLIVFAYGVADELHQLFIPGRSCEFLDFIADAVGGVVGIIILKILLRYFKESAVS